MKHFFISYTHLAHHDRAFKTCEGELTQDVINKWERELTKLHGYQVAPDILVARIVSIVQIAPFPEKGMVTAL